MKTSNRLLLAVLFIILGYILTFDFSLKAELLKGEFKSKFSHMNNLNLKNFNAVESNVGNFIDVNIEQGPTYSVWIDEGLKDQITITNHNKTLHIDYKGNGSRPRSNGRSITITCPTITNAVSNPFPTKMDLGDRSTIHIKGFTIDTLNVCANRSTEISLNKNIINKLTGKLGDSRAVLFVHGDNEVKEAHFNVLGRSELNILNPIIGKVTYNYTDSSTINLSGRALHLLQQ